MDLKTYQQEAARTAGTYESRAEACENAAMGLLGEFCGEVIDTLKKRKFHGHDIGDSLRDELGDALWYCAFSASLLGVELERATFHDFDDPYAAVVAIAEFARAMAYGGGTGEDLAQIVAAIATMAEVEGFTLDEVLEANVAKLRARYPRGFSVEDSIGRADG